MNHSVSPSAELHHPLAGLECSLLSGTVERNLTPPALYENAFQLWKATWENVIFPNGFVSDSFFNADTILLLHKELEVAALAVINHYDLKHLVYRYNTYLKDFRALEIIGDQDSFMTIEYICAAKAWRQKNLGIAKALIGLAQAAFEEAKADYLFGTARIDLGIDKLGPDFGFRSYGEINRYGLHCALMVNSTATNRVHPDPELVHLVKTLWNDRTDLTEKPKLKIAA